MYSSEWVLPEPRIAALQCVNSTFNDTGVYAAVASCGNGTRGEDLKKEAAEYMDATFPGGVGLPNVVIDNKEQEIAQNGTDFWRFTRAVCDAGANAGLCRALSPTTKKVVVTPKAKKVIV